MEDEEEQKRLKKLNSFPASIKVMLVCIVIRAITSRFVLAVHLLYLMDYVGMSQRAAKMWYHAAGTYFIWLYPVGAMCADSYFGYWKQYIVTSWFLAPVLYMSPLASIPSLGFPPYEIYIAETLLDSFQASLYFPTLEPLTGDQFVLPDQREVYTRYLLTSYWLHNLFSPIGQIVGPILRANVQCFGRNDCFALPLWINCLSYTIRMCIITVFWKLFTKNPPYKKNIFAQLAQLIYYAIRRKMKSEEVKEHWLDYGEDKFDKKFIEDVKRLRMLYMIIPILGFYILIPQESSAFIFQARRLNGDVGLFTILPDQMYVMNLGFCAILIPVFQYVIYPYLNKKGILTRRLHRIILGGYLYAISFIYCGILCYILEKGEHPEPKSGEGYLRIYNTMDCELSLNLSDEGSVVIKEMDYHAWLNLTVNSERTIKYSASCRDENENGTLEIVEGKMMSYNARSIRDFKGYTDDYRIDDKGLPTVRTLLNVEEEMEFQYKVGRIIEIQSNSSMTKRFTTGLGVYYFIIDGITLANETFRQGGDYVTLVREIHPGKYTAKILEIHPHNKISVLWMTPQYLVNVIGEILYSVSTTEFVYNQAPVNMKSCIQACQMIIKTSGSLFIIIVESIVKFSLSKNFFSYSSIMFINMTIFLVMAYFYKDVEPLNKTREILDKEKEKEKEDAKA